MRILIDVMGGDRPPLELLRGACMARDAFDAEIMVVGNEPLLREGAKEEGLSLDGIVFLHAEEVVTMQDRPMAVIREKNQSSMAVGLRALAQGEADAFVSTGNTGALLTGGTLIVRRIPGIQRAAIGAILPLSIPVLLMDAGANLDVTPEQMEQFAFMGSRYMSHLYGIDAPRVGQINNGVETTKGNKLQVETHALLSESKDIFFVGNIEAKVLPFGVCDVLLADGFTGNIVLKYTEGFGTYLAGCLKDMFTANLFTKLAYKFIMKRHLKTMYGRFDASEHGGAPLLGLAKPVIKAHGSSDAKAIMNAVRQALRVASTSYTQDVEQYAKEAKDKKEAARAAASEEQIPATE